MATQACNWRKRPVFTVMVTKVEGSTIVELAGELDISTAGELRERLVESDVLEAPRVAIDLSDVTFMDSVGIGVLVSACKRIRTSGGTFSVYCREGTTRRLLEIEGLIDYLEVRDPAGRLEHPGSMVEAWVEHVARRESAHAIPSRQRRALGRSA